MTSSSIIYAQESNQNHAALVECAQIKKENEIRKEQLKEAIETIDKVSKDAEKKEKSARSKGRIEGAVGGALATMLLIIIFGR